MISPHPKIAKRPRSYGQYIDSLKSEASRIQGRIRGYTGSHDLASMPTPEDIRLGHVSPKALKSILPCNREYLERNLATLMEGRVDRRNREEVQKFSELISLAGSPTGTESVDGQKSAWQELADYVEFELNYDIAATPWTMGAFQAVNLSAGDLPLIKTPYTSLERFEVTSMALDGTPEVSSWSSVQSIETMEMGYISTQQIEFRDKDLQTGSVNSVDIIKAKLQHSMDMHIDALGLININGAIVLSGLRDILHIEAPIIEAAIPDTNYLDLNGTDAEKITIEKLKAILIHIARFGSIGMADEKFTINNIQVSPLSMQDTWDFTDLVADTTSADPSTTVPSSVRESIFNTGIFMNAWGNTFTMTPNPQIAKGRMYIFGSQPLGWVFYKPEFDQFYMWDGRTVPVLAAKNKGLTQMTKAIKFYIPSLWKQRIVIVDY